MMHIPMTIVQDYTTDEKHPSIIVALAKDGRIQRFSKKRGLSIWEGARICRAVTIASEATGVATRDILGHSRASYISAARHRAYAEARALGLSYPVIGRGFRRDHSTIIYGVHKHGGAQ